MTPVKMTTDPPKVSPSNTETFYTFSMGAMMSGGRQPWSVTTVMTGLRESSLEEKGEQIELVYTQARVSFFIIHCRVERRTKSNQKSVKFNRNDSIAADDKKERVSIETYSV